MDEETTTASPVPPTDPTPEKSSPAQNIEADPSQAQENMSTAPQAQENTSTTQQAHENPSAASEAQENSSTAPQAQENTTTAPQAQTAGSDPGPGPTGSILTDADDAGSEQPDVQTGDGESDPAVAAPLADKEVDVADSADPDRGIALTDMAPGHKNGTTAEPIDAEDTEEAEKSSGEKEPASNTFIFVLTFFATLGGFLLGYDIGIVSGSMLYVTPFFKLTTLWTEIIVSGAVAAAAVSAISGGWVTDRIGRRPSMLIGSVVFSLGGVVMAVAPNKEVLLAGRIVCGLGIGLASVVVPIYVAEASPAWMRGRLTLMWQIMINLGILVSSLIAGVFSLLPRDVNWRYMLGLSAIPGVVQFVGFLFMPESPRWLVDRGRVDEARSVLVRTRGYHDVSEELSDIQRSVRESKAGQKDGFYQLVRIMTTPHTRRALIVGVGLLVIQQFCGINTAIYYSGSVMKMAGFPVQLAVWLVVVPNALLFLSGLIGLYVVDKIGRRPLLIWSMVGTIAGLIIIAVGFQLAEANVPVLDTSIVETYDNGTLIDSPCYSQYSTCAACVKDTGCGFCNQRGEPRGSCLPSAPSETLALHGRCNSTQDGYRFAHGYCPSDKYSWIATTGVALFVMLFSPGMGPMPWTINSEIYPLWARGTCNSIAAASCWVSNLVVSFTFLSLTEAITTYGTFWMFAGFSVLGLVFFLLLVPETKGRSLEEVEELFMGPAEVRDWRAAREKHCADSPSHGEPVVSL